MPDNETDNWLANHRPDKQGKLKIYIGMSAGV
jgi:K+-sensing histidine kinase KdpD